MLFSVNSAVEQKVIVATMVIALFYLHASDVGYTNTRSIEAECDFALKDTDYRSKSTKLARM